MRRLPIFRRSGTQDLRGLAAFDLERLEYRRIFTRSRFSEMLGDLEFLGYDFTPKGVIAIDTYPKCVFDLAQVSQTNLLIGITAPGSHLG